MITRRALPPTTETSMKRHRYGDGHIDATIPTFLHAPCRFASHAIPGEDESADAIAKLVFDFRRLRRCRELLERTSQAPVQKSLRDRLRISGRT